MALIEISSVTGEGLEELKRQIWAMLEQIARQSQAPIPASDRATG
jgi:selenocysteine-specific translation elongation factor